MARRHPIFANRTTALWLGYGGFLVGVLGMWDAYEGRGRARPFLGHLLP